jgi:hypothetical protein
MKTGNIWRNGNGYHQCGESHRNGVAASWRNGVSWQWRIMAQYQQ